MIPGAIVRKSKCQQIVSYKLFTARASFLLTPQATPNTYKVQVTPKDLPGVFKNSNACYDNTPAVTTGSGFGPFLLERLPGRNAVSRPNNCAPLFGNALRMWGHVDQVEKMRLFDYLEKLIRSEVPKIELPKPATMPLAKAA